MKQCIICDSQDTYLILKNMKWYTVNICYNIYHCKVCWSNFVSNDTNIDESIYDKVYSIASNYWWYDRYKSYSKIIKQQDQPLKYLSNIDHIYLPIYNFLKDKKWLKILEIWCWYGYLTYSICKEWNDCTWVDISSEAINYANKNYWNYYIHTNDASINNFFESGSFDLIIATELIEHLKNPSNFFKDISSLIKKDGHIIITTPNKSCLNKRVIWKWDQPPVHLSFITDKWLKKLSENNKLSYSFFNYIRYNNSYNNFLARIIQLLSHKIYGLYPKTYQYLDNHVIIEKKYKILNKLFESKIIKYPCNYILAVFSKYYNNYQNLFWTLCIICKK